MQFDFVIRQLLDGAVGITDLNGDECSVVRIGRQGGAVGREVYAERALRGSQSGSADLHAAAEGEGRDLAFSPGEREPCDVASLASGSLASDQSPVEAEFDFFRIGEHLDQSLDAVLAAPGPARDRVGGSPCWFGDRLAAAVQRANGD